MCLKRHKHPRVIVSKAWAQKCFPISIYLAYIILAFCNIFYARHVNSHLIPRIWSPPHRHTYINLEATFILDPNADKIKSIWVGFIILW